jgi:hypothetical protein
MPQSATVFPFLPAPLFFSQGARAMRHSIPWSSCPSRPPEPQRRRQNRRQVPLPTPLPKWAPPPTIFLLLFRAPHLPDHLYLLQEATAAEENHRSTTVVVECHRWASNHRPPSAAPPWWEPGHPILPDVLATQCRCSSYWPHPASAIGAPPASALLYRCASELGVVTAPTSCPRHGPVRPAWPLGQASRLWTWAKTGLPLFPAF